MRTARRLLFGSLAAGTLLAGLPALALAADEAPTIDSGDTAWLLIATALVMVMLPGLALFYGGLVRRKNVLSTIMHSFFGLALVSVVWVLVGFSLAFGPDVKSASGPHRRPRLRRLHGRRPRAQHRSTASTIPFVLFAAFQLMFAAITPALITRRLRRAQAVRRVRAVHDPVVDPRLLADRALGLGGRTAGCSSSAPSTSRAARSSTSSSGVSALVVALLIGRRVVNGDRMEPARHADDRPRRGPAVVRLVRLQRRLGARRQRPRGQRAARDQHRGRRGDDHLGARAATSTSARSASSARRAARSRASWRSRRRRAS